jgi:multidrug transporter EmrE-like cation transporter
MKLIVWSFLFIGVGLNAAAQLLLKGATRIAGPLVSDAGRIEWPNATALLQTLPLWGGLACYGVSLLMWLAALSRLPVSVAYPMLSVGYVVNAAAAAFLYGEALTMQKVIGIALVSVGVIVLSRAA